MRVKQRRNFTLLALLLLLAISNQSNQHGTLMPVHALPVPVSTKSNTLSPRLQLLRSSPDAWRNSRRKDIGARRQTDRVGQRDRPPKTLLLDLASLSVYHSPSMLDPSEQEQWTLGEVLPFIEQVYDSSNNDNKDDAGGATLALDMEELPFEKRGGKGMSRHLAAAALAATMAVSTAGLSVFANSLKAHDQDKYGVSKKANLSSDKGSDKGKANGDGHGGQKVPGASTSTKSSSGKGGSNDGTTSPASPTYITNITHINNYYSSNGHGSHGRRQVEDRPVSSPRPCSHCEQGGRGEGGDDDDGDGDNDYDGDDGDDGMVRHRDELRAAFDLHSMLSNLLSSHPIFPHSASTGEEAHRLLSLMRQRKKAGQSMTTSLHC